MTADELLRAGRLEAALATLQDEVRRRPDHAPLRVFLFQLLAVLGQWTRAAQQLQVAGELEAGTLAMVQTYRAALACEALRAEVFAGRLTPLLLGRPDDWVALLVEALRLDGEGRTEAARQLRGQALDAAPAVAGQLNGEDFAWCADADPRLGPVLELIVNGRYAWLPLPHLQSLACEPPADLRDLVWLPARLTLANGGESVALIPSRYPDTPRLGDDAARLARKTDWPDDGLPLGQRMFVTDRGDCALFELRRLTFAAQEP
ncbi:type VI secretion system protein ImpE [Azotobacter beijerinckii]|uniref:Type VI secretion system protein ImpE n=1 Tax=Azotobacter beijerinckii TaxID=170623 RepID=A0A1H6R0P2_9GAMM|nr:type VI secretion system accessory protein TagJ [Azotobacter beijerinckii]SEI46804.1 type VI secretion system protein ImpE [Azotobacter beijerinckii]